MMQVQYFYYDKKCKLEVVRLSNPWEKHYKIYKSVHPRIQYNSIPYSTLLAYPSDQTVCHRYKAIINNIQYSYVYIYIYIIFIRCTVVEDSQRLYVMMQHDTYNIFTLYHLVSCITLYLMCP